MRTFWRYDVSITTYVCTYVFVFMYVFMCVLCIYDFIHIHVSKCMFMFIKDTSALQGLLCKIIRSTRSNLFNPNWCLYLVRFKDRQSHASNIVFPIDRVFVKHKLDSIFCQSSPAAMTTRGMGFSDKRKKHYFFLGIPWSRTPYIKTAFKSEYYGYQMHSIANK